MPRGFDVASGSDLPERLTEILGSFVAGIKKRSIENPVTADQIVAGYAALGKRIGDSDVRALVHRCRTDCLPIGSSREGYFWARNREELNATIEHLQDRESAIRAARIGLEKSFKHKEEDLFSETPIG